MEENLGMTVYTYNPNTGEAETGLLWVLGQPRLYYEAMSQKKKKLIKIQNKEKSSS